uniref:Uncharacterized protein n=1 Tax=viral metagenome TaxID=1070528 RepID=A0A6M3XCC2_9ZZZZ
MAKQSINESPDERRPEKVNVDGKEVAFDDLINGYKFTQANHQRAEELKREKAQLENERQAWAREREDSSQERKAYLDTLNRFAPKAEATNEPPPLNYREAISQIDLVADAEAPQKLGQVIDVALANERESERREWQKRLEQVNQTFNQRLDKVQQEQSTKLSRQDARRQAQEHNDKLFNDTLKSKYGEVATQIGDEGIRAVRKAYEAQISNDYGELDRAGQWRWKESAVEAAVWAAAPSRKVMLARETANARTQQLGARVRGDDASRSTPIRTQRAAAGDPADALAQKEEQVLQMVRSRQYSPEEAFEQVGFTDDEVRALNERRHQGA